MWPHKKTGRAAVNVLLRFGWAAAFAVAWGSIGRGLSAHETESWDVSFSCDVAEVGATLVFPGHDQKAGTSQNKTPCVVLIGGTLSHTRDGKMVRDGVPERDALKRLAEALAVKGYASLRYDKVGYGQSRPTPAWTGTYQDEARVASAAIEFARKQDRFGKIVAVGESAGAYLECLAAQAGVEADAYVFLGGHCGSGEAIYEYNFARLARLAESDPAWRDLAEKQLRFELALGRSYKGMFAAAARGEEAFQLVDGDFQKTIGLARRNEEIAMPPDKMFRFIKGPALALSGEFDLNVPPDHAAKIVQVLRAAGNHASTCVLIPGADHNFQMSPDDEQARLRERYTFDSFRRDYAPQAYQEIVAWLDDTLGRASIGSKLPSVVQPGHLPIRAGEESERDARTENTPARLHLAPGIQIIGDITDKEQTVGVSTLEGEIGPLLLGEDCQAHFIDMPGGLYCEEHPHSSESIIYTVRGKWVLCSKGRRHVMKPGTLFHFSPNTPTGYEVPFAEPTLILIFKGKRLTDKEEDFIRYLQSLAERLEREHDAGVPYLLSDLPADHPARQFATEVNPEFGKEAKAN